MKRNRGIAQSFAWGERTQRRLIHQEWIQKNRPRPIIRRGKTATCRIFPNDIFFWYIPLRRRKWIRRKYSGLDGLRQSDCQKDIDFNPTRFESGSMGTRSFWSRLLQIGNGWMICRQNSTMILFNSFVKNKKNQHHAQVWMRCLSDALSSRHKCHHRNTQRQNVESRSVGAKTEAGRRLYFINRHAWTVLWSIQE